MTQTNNNNAFFSEIREILQYASQYDLSYLEKGIHYTLSSELSLAPYNDGQ